MRLAALASTGALQKNQACAPLPERERWIVTGRPAWRPRLGEDGDVLAPGAFIEIHRQQPAGFVLKQGVDAHDVPALEMIEDDLIADREEGLVGAIAAFAAR